MTASATSVHEALSRVLTYPGADYLEFVQELPRALSDTDPELQAAVGLFASEVEGLSLTEIQEVFTRTFDLNPACSLEVGWHLFGEEYARGAFMVSIRERLRRYGVEENGELPDHLTHLLLLLEAMDASDRGKLAGAYVLPAVRKMLKALEGKENPYGGVIQAVAGMLERTPGASAAEKEEVRHG